MNRPAASSALGRLQSESAALVGPRSRKAEREGGDEGQKEKRRRSSSLLGSLRTCNPSAALLCNRNVLTPSIAHPNSKGTDRESFERPHNGSIKHSNEIVFGPPLPTEFPRAWTASTRPASHLLALIWMGERARNETSRRNRAPRGTKEGGSRSVEHPAPES